MPAPKAAALRVLLVISRPRAIDVAFRSVASQLARLAGGDGGVLQLDVLRPPGFARLATVLHAAGTPAAPYHVVHFDGHGVWADPDDRGGSGNRLRARLAGTGSPVAAGRARVPAV